MATSTAIVRTSSSHRPFVDWLAKYWFPLFAFSYGVWVWTPWLAPIFMKLGWNGTGHVIYSIYSFFCHQLPERSFFLFGQKPMYSLAQIQAVFQNTSNPALLRRFIGDPQKGWKVAWSDRMVSFYTSIWAFGLLWWYERRKVKALSWWGFFLLLLPMALDGGTHALSDFAGIEHGFRETNPWLVTLTHHAFNSAFYAGNALGSFNSWMRLLTGLLAGLGVAWFVFPTIRKAQMLDRELERNEYGKVIEQIRNKDPRFVGR